MYSLSHTIYYFFMYNIKNDECPYDESYNVGCVIILGDLKYLTRDTFRVDSLVSGIFHIFQALTGCFMRSSTVLITQNGNILLDATSN